MCLKDHYARASIKMANAGDFYHHPGMAEITLVESTLNFVCIMIDEVITKSIKLLLQIVNKLNINTHMVNKIN